MHSEVIINEFINEKGKDLHKKKGLKKEILIVGYFCCFCDYQRQPWESAWSTASMDEYNRHPWTSDDKEYGR